MNLGDVFDGRYRLEEQLGEGENGTVFRATQLTLAREVAIKILGKGRILSSRSLERFRREAEAMVRLVHPNVVQLYEFGVEEITQAPYLVTELIRGSALLEHRVFSDEEAQFLMRQLMQVLVFAHQKQVIHRDLKPANLMIAGARLKVLDFGLAKILDDELHPLTTPGAVLGTPFYMSPEQARGEVVGPATDIYAAGCIFHELTHGEPLFVGESLNEILTKKLAGYSGSSPLIGRMLAIDPAARPSAEEVLDALTPAPAAVVKSAGRRRIWGTVVLAVVSIALLLLVPTRVERSPMPERIAEVKPLAQPASPQTISGPRRILVTTGPPGAVVYVDDKYLGVAPLELEVPEQGCVVRAEKDGYRTVSREVGEDTPTKIELSLAKNPPLAEPPPAEKKKRNILAW